jgi:hypothetical protein
VREYVSDHGSSGDFGEVFKFKDCAYTYTSRWMKVCYNIFCSDFYNFLEE